MLAAHEGGSLFIDAQEGDELDENGNQARHVEQRVAVEPVVELFGVVLFRSLGEVDKKTEEIEKASQYNSPYR